MSLKRSVVQAILSLAFLFHLSADECCWGRFQPRIDFLYWQADEDGLEYGTKFIATEEGSPGTVDTKLLDLHFDWDPGFRVGLGYLIADLDSWALNLSWTHIRNHAHGKATAEGIEGQITSTNTIIPIWVTLLDELRWGASSASAHWCLDYNTVDLEFGRDLCLSERLSLRPYFGVRGAWIDQDYKAKYNCVFIPEESAPTFTRVVTFKGDNDFKAVGIRAGSEVVFNLSSHWHLFSQISANLLYGHFSVKMKNLNDQGLGDMDTFPMPTDFYASEHFWRGRLAFEEAVGLGWERLFRCEQYRLCLRTAFEMSQWLNQNQLFTTFYFRASDAMSLFPVRNQGDLSFMGVRISAQLDF